MKLPTGTYQAKIVDVLIKINQANNNYIQMKFLVNEEFVYFNLVTRLRKNFVQVLNSLGFDQNYIQTWQLDRSDAGLDILVFDLIGIDVELTLNYSPNLERSDVVNIVRREIQ